MSKVQIDDANELIDGIKKMELYTLDLDPTEPDLGVFCPGKPHKKFDSCEQIQGIGFCGKCGCILEDHKCKTPPPPPQREERENRNNNNNEQNNDEQRSDNTNQNNDDSDNLG